MEVHAPHEPIHTWRDFFIHIATIVVGLLIAIGLEQTVEWVHHKHIVREARENIHRELESNHESAQKDFGFLDANIARIKKNIETLQILAKRPKEFHGSLSNTMEFAGLNASAWNSARDTGALGYMPYESVQKLSEIYENQEFVKTEAINTFRDEVLALAPAEMGVDITKLPDADYQTMLHQNASTLIQLMTLKQLIQQLENQYTEQLKQS
jgi:hypothetical protein